MTSRRFSATASFARHISPMKSSSTTAPPYAPRRSRSISATPSHPHSRPNSQRIKNQSIYDKRVFFIRNLGFITNNEARRITFEETLRFEKIHEETYRNHGFELLYIEPGVTARSRHQNQVDD